MTLCHDPGAQIIERILVGRFRQRARRGQRRELRAQRLRVGEELVV